MKFSDGFWLSKSGINVNFAKQAYEIKQIECGLSIYVTTSYIHNRGMTLQGPCFETEITSKTENVIKVSVFHYKGSTVKIPKFEINESGGYKPQISEKDDCWEILSGKTLVKVSKDNWSIKYFYDGKPITQSGEKSLSYIVEDCYTTKCRNNYENISRFWEGSDKRSTYMREQLSVDVGEYFYGFGERFTPFVKNGQSVEIWNADGGTCSGQSYKSIPFYLSSKGYGVFVNSTDNVYFEVCSDCVSKVSFSVSGESLEYFVIGGSGLKEVIENYTDLTGKPALVPPSSMGLWLTTSFTTNYDEKTVTSFINGMAERKIPLQYFHFDCFWMREFQWCDFTWDDRSFPEPVEMLNRLKARGLKICVWINPYIGQKSSLFSECKEKGYLIKNTNGSVFQCDFWQPGMAIVDFTNPGAKKWYQDKLIALCRMGVDCFKTDFGERIPTEAVYYDGSDSHAMHNFYTYLYNKAVFEVLELEKGVNNACLFARSATVGSQKFPVHWGGDCSAEYTSMAETIRGGLSLGMCGFGFFSHDISGFESTATPDIYKRWTAFGLLSSHSRLHGNSSYRVPWLFDDEAVDVLRYFTNLKGQLMPYLWAKVVEAHQKGLPVMRAMILEYPHDKVCQTLDMQYMLGDKLLTAPIMNDCGIGDFYLPDCCGKWIDILSGKEYSGGKFYKERYDYFSLPLLSKPDSIVAYGDFKGNFEYDYLENTRFEIYSPTDEKVNYCNIYDSNGGKVFTLSAMKKGNNLTISYIGGFKPFSVQVHEYEEIKIEKPFTDEKILNLIKI